MADLKIVNEKANPKQAKRKNKKRIKVCPICFIEKSECRCIKKCDESYTICLKCGNAFQVDNICKHSKTQKCRVDNDKLKNGLVLFVLFDEKVCNVASLIKSIIKLNGNNRVFAKWIHSNQEYEINENGKRIRTEQMRFTEMDLMMNKINYTDFQTDNIKIFLLSSSKDRTVSWQLKEKLNKSKIATGHNVFCVFGNERERINSKVLTYLPLFYDKLMTELNLNYLRDMLEKMFLNYDDVKKGQSSKLEYFTSGLVSGTNEIVIYPIPRQVVCSICYTKRGRKETLGYQYLFPQKLYVIHKCKEHPKGKRNGVCNFCGEFMLIKNIKLHELNDCKNRMPIDSFFSTDKKTVGVPMVVGSVKSMKDVSSVFARWIKFKYPKVFLSFIVEDDWDSLQKKLSMLSWNQTHEYERNHGLFLFVDQTPFQGMCYDINQFYRQRGYTDDEGELQLYQQTNESISFVQFIWLHDDPKSEIQKFHSLHHYIRKSSGICMDHKINIFKICNFDEFPDIKSIFQNAKISSKAKDPVDYTERIPKKTKRSKQFLKKFFAECEEQANNEEYWERERELQIKNKQYYIDLYKNKKMM